MFSFIPYTFFPITCGVAGVCVEGQNFDILVIGPRSKQLPAGTPRNAIDRAFMVFNAFETDVGLLCWTLSTKEEEQRKSIMTNTHAKEFF